MPDRDACRTVARQLFDAAVAAADPAAAVRRHLAARPLGRVAGRTFIVAVGKAAPAMVRAALDALPGPVTALAVTHHENAQSIDGATVLTAGHPVPDQHGIAAAGKVIALLATATASDQVLALISGGGSALLPAPTAPLTLADKQQVSQVLLASGLDITAMNMVRQHLSDLKGGGLLRHAAPAPVTALILSDVIGNDLRAIASGPTAAAIASKAETVAMLRELSLFDTLPATARSILERPDRVLPPVDAANHLIGSNHKSLMAMAVQTPAPFAAHIIDSALIGDVEAAADRVIGAALAHPGDGPAALLFGGETTVHLRGTGSGGRNQELALRVALAGARLPPGWVFLSGGTDGRDGPTVAAGGITDDGTLARIGAAGHDVAALLANNDSNTALAAAGDLLLTGATGTNVADVQVLLLP